MKISCVMPTFNRVAAKKHLIEEAVESFLRQTYTDAELVIANDHPQQIVKFDHPRVRIFNWCNRACSLGEKYNDAIRATEGDLITTWEDDDLSLPHRLEYSVEKLGDAEYYNPLGYWYLTNKLHHIFSRGYSHNCSIFTRAAFEKVGGYDPVTGNQDALMDGKLRKCKTVLGPISPKDWFYLYRFGVSDLHLSGQGDSQKAYDDYAKHANKTGTFILNPNWRMDYSKMVSDYIKEHNLS